MKKLENLTNNYFQGLKQQIHQDICYHYKENHILRSENSLELDSKRSAEQQFYKAQKTSQKEKQQQFEKCFKCRDTSQDKDISLDDFVKDKEQLPFKEALELKRQQDHIDNHILKCFTFGKKLKRVFDEDPEKLSKVEILKRRFMRIGLLREYFSVQKSKNPRKFKFPIDEHSRKDAAKLLEVYDELQYCQESDVEEIKKPKKKQNDLDKTMEKILKERHQSLDLNKENRLDIKIIKNMDLSSFSQKKQNTSTNSFDSLDSDSRRSIYSSPRQQYEKEILDFDKVMPFDFVTQRKVKQFFQQETTDLNTLLMDKEQARKLIRKQIKDLQEEVDEAEVYEQLDIPETNTRVKEHNKIKLGQNKNKSLSSSSSESERDYKFEDYKYGQKVQNTQLRDQNNDLQMVFFQRSNGKNLKHKKRLMQKLAEFKNKITEQQRQVLQDRQFVIVDKKSLEPKQLKQKFFDKRGPPPKQFEEKQELEQKEAEKIRQSKLSKMAKLYIMREKSAANTRNNSISKFSREYDETINSTNMQKSHARNVMTALSSGQSSVTNLNTSMPQRSLIVEAYGNTILPLYHNKTRTLNQFSNQFALNSAVYLNSSESRTNLQTNDAYSPSLAFLETPVNFNQSLRNIDNGCNTTTSLGFTLSQTKMNLQMSPYTQIDKDFEKVYPATNRHKSQSVVQPMRMKSYMVDKLKKKSVLNNDLFKQSGINYKSRISTMLDQLNAVLGTRYGKKANE